MEGFHRSPYSRFSLSASSSSSTSSHASFSSYADEFRDAYEQPMTSSDRVASPESVNSAVQSPSSTGSASASTTPDLDQAPGIHKFSRYRSLRKGAGIGSGGLRSPPRSMNPEPNTSTLAQEPQSRSRYRRNRPRQATQEKLSPPSFPTEVRMPAARVGQSQQEAYHALKAESIDRVPIMNQSIDESTYVDVSRIVISPERQKHGPDNAKHSVTPTPTRNKGQRSVDDPKLVGRPSYNEAHNALTDTVQSGASSWSSIHDEIPASASRNISQSKVRPFTTPTTGTSHSPSVSRYVNVSLSSDVLTLPVGPSFTAQDLLALAAEQRLYFDAETALLTESLPTLGLERPIRPYERISEVLESWDYDGQHDLLVLTPESLNEGASSSGQPNSLAPPKPPQEKPVELQVSLSYLMKSRKWINCIVSLREDGQVIVSTGKGEATKIGHMSDFDGYMVRGRRRRAVLGRIQGRKRYVVAIKSQQKAARFEAKEDYIHFFAGGKEEVRRWWDGVLAWRAWYLAWGRGLAMPSKASDHILRRKSPEDATAGKDARPDAGPARSSEQQSRTKATRKAFEKADEGLIAHAQNADASFIAVEQSRAQRTVLERPSTERRNEDHEDGNRLLVDLTAPSAFQKGSLLAGVEAREREVRKARSGPKPWK